MAVVRVVAGRAGPPAAYDAAAEAAGYSRALLSAGDLAQLQADIGAEGFFTIEQVRELVRANTAKETQEARGEAYAIDPEIMMQIDVRVDFNVFVAGDSIFTREELLRQYAFEALGLAPEDVFAQQEVGVFPPKKWAMGGDDPADASPDGAEFVSRDVGDDGEFVMVEDLVGCAARAGYETRRAPARVVLTKIYLGKEAWDDFTRLAGLARAARRFGGGGDSLALFAAPPASAPRALEVAAPAPKATASASAPPASPPAAPPAPSSASPDFETRLGALELRVAELSAALGGGGPPP